MEARTEADQRINPGPIKCLVVYKSSVCAKRKDTGHLWGVKRGFPLNLVRVCALIIPFLIEEARKSEGSYERERLPNLQWAKWVRAIR
jgi:hypothetical protein